MYIHIHKYICMYAIETVMGLLPNIISFIIIIIIIIIRINSCTFWNTIHQKHHHGVPTNVGSGSSLDPSSSLSAAGLQHGDHLSALVQLPRMAATAPCTMIPIWGCPK